MSYDIVEVRVAVGHALELIFEDGMRGKADLSGYAAKGGVFRRFADPEYFKLAHVNRDLGTVCWPDGLDIAPETLYALATGRKPVSS